MAQIILDIGSGNSLKSLDIAKRMIDEVVAIDSRKHKVIFKAQLFLHQPPNTPLDFKLFGEIWEYGQRVGYEVTASVFGRASLDFLLRYSPCFIKIACRSDLYWLIAEIPRNIPVYVSVPVTNYDINESNVTKLVCVPKYPADVKEYPKVPHISDHVVGLELWDIAKPQIWEKHYVLEHDDTNPDAGLFAVTPQDLKAIL